MLQIGLDISRGIGDAQIHQFLRQGNHDANLGMNYFFSSLTSFHLIETALRKVNTVIQYIEFTKIPSISSPIIFSASLCIPLTLTYIKKSIDFTSHPNLHAIIATLDNCIFPSVILVTNLVASVALIVFGNPVYGGCNLTFLLLNLLDEQGLINTEFIQNNPLFVNTLLLCKINSLLSKFSLYNIYLLIDIIIDKSDNIITYINKKNAINNITPTITLQEYKSKLPTLILSQYRLNNYHLLKNPISNIPIKNLENQFDHYINLLKECLECIKQDLSIDNSRILRILRDDEKWKSDYNNNPIDYLNNGINKFIRDIKLTKDKDFKNKFLSLVQYLSDVSKDEGIYFLTQLAQTGHYCPERQHEDIRVFYDTYIDKIEKRALSNKLITILHQERTQILDQVLAFISYTRSFLNSLTNLDKQNPLSNENKKIVKNYLKRLSEIDEKGLDEKGLDEIVESFGRRIYAKERSIYNIVSDTIMKFIASLMPPTEDIHFANEIKNYLSSYFYTHHESIDVLTKDRRSKLDKWIFALVHRDFIEQIQKIFSNQYNPETVLQRIAGIISWESIFRLDEIKEWFTRQYQASYPEATQKEAVTWFQENVYDQEIFTIEPSYVRFFLINEGVLELIEDSQNTTNETILPLISSPTNSKQTV